MSASVHLLPLFVKCANCGKVLGRREADGLPRFCGWVCADRWRKRHDG